MEMHDYSWWTNITNFECIPDFVVNDSLTMDSCSAIARCRDMPGDMSHGLMYDMEQISSMSQIEIFVPKTVHATAPDQNALLF